MDKFWRSAGQCLVACVAPVSLTVVCSELHVNLATAALLLMIVVVLLSRVGSFSSSIVASFIAALCLAYVAPPAFSFRVDDPLDDVAVVAFLVTSIIIASLVSRVRKQMEDALCSVGSRVIEAEERERRRIAHDLHEGIGQRVTLLVINIQRFKAASPDTADVPSPMDVLLKESSEILIDVKTLAHELYSLRLEYIGITGAMRGFCQEYGLKHRVEIDFRSTGVPSVIPPELSLCLFRVLQEALHNAVEHSGVWRFGVQLNGTSKEIHLRVNDFGVGFNLENAKTSRGLGINHMKERLKLVKGTLSIDSQPRRGTTIHACVPLGLGSDSMPAAAITTA